jgi:hypothetical protein
MSVLGPSRTANELNPKQPTFACATLSTCGRAKSNFPSVRFGMLVFTALAVWVFAPVARGEAAGGRKGSAMIFPDANWAKAEAKDVGIVDVTVLEEFDDLMRKAKANRVLARNGRVAAEWSYGGPMDKQFAFPKTPKPAP